jgi:hypothetical protein
MWETHEGPKPLNYLHTSVVLLRWRQVVDDKANLLAKANKYRNLARWIGDRETVQRVLALADELMQKARALVKPAEERIRKRARKIWEENGRPPDRDDEFCSKPSANCKKRS